MALEDLILGLLEGAAEFNFTMLFRVLFICLILVWLMVVVWAWKDATSRSDSLIFSIFATFIVFVLNIFGLIIYLLIRPKELLDDQYWADLERRYLLYETDELRDCVECGYQLRPGFNLCPQCGTVTKIACEGCQEMISKHWPYCPYCGKVNDMATFDNTVPQPSINKNYIVKKEEPNANNLLLNRTEASLNVNHDKAIPIKDKEVKDDSVNLNNDQDLEVVKNSISKNSKLDDESNIAEIAEEVEITSEKDRLELDNGIKEQVYIDNINNEKSKPVLNGVDSIGKKAVDTTVTFGAKVHQILLKIVKPFTTPIGQSEVEVDVEPESTEVAADELIVDAPQDKKSRIERRSTKKNKKKK